MAPVTKPPPLSEDTLRQLIEQQSKEQAVRSQELSIRSQELDYQSKHASAILAAQATDREQGRAHERHLALVRIIALVLLTLAVIGFACWGIYINKEGIVRDVVQMILSGAIGGIGGYGLGKTKGKKEESDE